MAGIEARQQGPLNPEVEVGERADAAPVLLSTTHRKGDKRDGCTTTKAVPREVRDLVS